MRVKLDILDVQNEINLPDVRISRASMMLARREKCAQGMIIMMLVPPRHHKTRMGHSLFNQATWWAKRLNYLKQPWRWGNEKGF